MRFHLSPRLVIDSTEDPWKREGIRIGVYGAPGSGKSYTVAGGFIEQALAQKATVVIFQPRAEYHTLKEKYPVQVVGGPYQDLPFITRTPKLYAEAVVKNGISLIFNTGDVEEEERLIEFATSFLGHLLKLEETVKRPLLLILEEAHEYCPANARGHIAPPWVYNRMVKLFKDCFTQGRKLGINPIAISQRPQELNFTIRQIANLTLYGKFSPQDISYIDKECLSPYRKRGIKVDSGQLLDLVTGNWLIITAEGAGIEKLDIKRTTRHGADTPTLDYVAPVSEETKKTVTELGKLLQTELEKARSADTELEKAKNRLSAAERTIEELRRKADVAETLRDAFGKMKPGKVPEESLTRLEKVSDYETKLSRLEAEASSLRKDNTALQDRLSKYDAFRDALRNLIEIDHPLQPTLPLTSLKADMMENLIPRQRQLMDYLHKFPSIWLKPSQVSTALNRSMKSSYWDDDIQFLEKLGILERGPEGLRAK